VKPLECKRHFFIKCRLAYRPGAALAEITESRLPCNGKDIHIAFLDNRKKCDEVAMDVTVVMIPRGRVASKHPIEMQCQCRIACRKHGYELGVKSVECRRLAKRVLRFCRRSQALSDG
jgi:hypothetical protein